MVAMLHKVFFIIFVGFCSEVIDANCVSNNTTLPISTSNSRIVPPPMATTTVILPTISPNFPEFIYADIKEMILIDKKQLNVMTELDFCKFFIMFGLPKNIGFLCDNCGNDSSTLCVVKHVAGLIHTFNDIETARRFSKLEKYVRKNYSKYDRFLDTLINYVEKYGQK